MRTLDPTILASFEKLLTGDVVVWVVAITLNDGTAFYLTRNVKNVVYLGRTYQATNLEIPDFDDSGDGDLPTATLTIENVGRFAMSILEDSARPWDQAKVVFMLAYLPDPTIDTKLRFELHVQAATANDEVVTLTLGSANWFDRPFPNRRYLRDEGFPGIPRHVQ